MSSKDVVCVFHGNCADGFGAAWVVKQAFLQDNVVFIPGVYQTDVDYTQFQNKSVVIVDFSYPRHVMLNIADVARSITWIDHHKSALDNMQGWKDEAKCPVIERLTTERSGAYLTWEHFFPHTQMPKLIEHIDDRDRWIFALNNTKEIQAAVFSYPYNFDVWNDLMLYTDMDKLADEGVAIERKHLKDIHELLGVNQREMDIGGYVVATANLPYTLSSDAGHFMCLDKTYPFAACYSINRDGQYIFSLRSADDGLDVSAIAKKYGGGGHPHAAGFSVGFYNVTDSKVYTDQEMVPSPPSEPK